MPASVDNVLAEAKRLGFKLCNMFEIDDAGTFRANFIAGGKGRSFGTHKLPGIAMAQALQNAVKEAAEDASTEDDASDDDDDLIG